MLLWFRVETGILSVILYWTVCPQDMEEIIVIILLMTYVYILTVLMYGEIGILAKLSLLGAVRMVPNNPELIFGYYLKI